MATVKDLELSKFKKVSGAVLRDAQDNAFVNTAPIDSLGFEWSYFVVSYPDSVTEVYSFYKNGDAANKTGGELSGTVGLRYTDSSKSLLLDGYKVVA